MVAGLTELGFVEQLADVERIRRRLGREKPSFSSVTGTQALGITAGVSLVAMHAGATVAIVDPSKAKGGIVYLPATTAKWASAVDQGVYNGGGRAEGPFVAVGKVSLGKTAFIGDSSPVEDASPKYKGEDTGGTKTTYGGWQEASDATVQQLEICNDTIDNDKNSKVDCADPVCLDKACFSDAGVRLCDETGACVCSTGTDEDCTNFEDDNCDGKVDCADPMCDQQACNVNPGVGGRCNTKVCTCTPGTEICSNGFDDDCDGKTDCVDTDCRATASALGKVCDAVKGLTCSVPDNAGKSICAVCPGGSGSEALCADGKDNDCDGLVDCLDSDCDTKACKSAFSTSAAGNGWTCNLASVPTDKCECSGNGGASQMVETTCDDGFDNDCDTTIDCADTDCLTAGGQVCGTYGKKCLALNTCACGATVENCKTPQDDNCNSLVNCEETSCRPGGSSLGALCDESGNTCSQVIGGVSLCNTCTVDGGTVETAEGSTGGASITCGDGKDNDCDSTVANPSTDCQDPECSGRPCSRTGGICSYAIKKCACPGGLSNEQNLCNDGIDNDCDGQIDCADADCQPGPSLPASACGSGNGRLCTAGGTCACSGNGGTAEITESSCSDGMDNDCDGLVDCTDTDCRPAGNALGKICDAKGNTCANPVAGVSACNVCSGSGGQAQSSEFSCGDGKDNDCNGLVDCQDPRCDSLACTSSGKRCVGASLTCVCPGTQALGETSCSDGLDNDCDGLVDCFDPNCQPVAGNAAGACSTTGKSCTAAGVCACSGNGGTAEATEGALGPSTCGDTVDNDCDGVIDCLDTDCRATTAGVFGKDCSRAPLFATKCDVSGVCVCPGGQATEATCVDGLDNDCDGKIDCSDSDCANQLCPGGNGKRCSGSPLTCACPGGQATETTCNDGLDNDCDGLVDCADPNCQGNPGQLCNVANTSYKCIPSGSSEGGLVGSWVGLKRAHGGVGCNLSGARSVLCSVTGWMATRIGWQCGHTRIGCSVTPLGCWPIEMTRATLRRRRW